MIKVPVFVDREATGSVTLDDLPDPASLDDELLDMWQLTTEGFEINPVILDVDELNERYFSWEGELNAEWNRRFPDGKSPTVIAAGL
jgi:hypothetical protein